ncbi:hypothetical protein BVH56_01905 [Abyssicoccus albus]|uniref:hypothetical protein n=2 Tax=Abyssicoccus albus TaxID=1817405 RepID=UPI00097E1DFB|nr:hypothetical protein [Abyssicoccus albus]AQL55782.1 hypothetical protein BVH56_01905 [Abyssicoccus albus]
MYMNESFDGLYESIVIDKVLLKSQGEYSKGYGSYKIDGNEFIFIECVNIDILTKLNDYANAQQSFNQLTINTKDDRKIYIKGTIHVQSRVGNIVCLHVVY